MGWARISQMNDFSYAKINQGKEGFGDIYNCSDPRSYFTQLSAHSYAIPQEAKPQLETIMGYLQKQRRRRVLKVVDLGCSYGVNGAILKRDIEWSELQRYFCETKPPQKSSIEVDRAYFSSFNTNSKLDIVGFDVADKAVEYGIQTGFIDDGVVADLETSSLTKSNAFKARNADLIISTGCVGYISEKTFGKILTEVEFEIVPWVASFVLRMFPYTDIEDELESHGLFTEKLSSSLFFQRNFVSEIERRNTLAELERLGVDPTPEYDGNCFYAELYLSRPQNEIVDKPVTLVANVK